MSQPRGKPPEAAADTGPVVHNLYVLVVDKQATAPNEMKSRELTLRILNFIHGRLALFTEMGIKIRVHKVRKSDLQNQRLAQAMKAKKISSLPALVTPNNTYLGNREIEEVYEKNVQEFNAWKRRGVESPAGLAPEDELDTFYQSEMTFERAEADGGDDDDTIGEGTDMMDSYRMMVQKRETRDASRPRGGRPPPAKSAAPRPAAPSRPNNLGQGATDSMDNLIDRMAGEIDAQTLEDAFSDGGGDSLEDDTPGVNAQDDLMERAYWANQELSM